MDPPTRADLQAAPARPDHLTPAARQRVEDALQEIQPIVFGLFAPLRVESVTPPEV